MPLKEFRISKIPHAGSPPGQASFLSRLTHTLPVIFFRIARHCTRILLVLLAIGGF